MSKSKKLFGQAKKIIPSGVNSPVRYFEPFPFYVKRSQGSSLWDEDGKHYIDFCNGYGAVLLGHVRKEVNSRVATQLKQGVLYGAPSSLEIELSKLVIKNFPSMEMIRLVNTGAEATMTAVRLTRGFTKKKKIVKFEGCYHGAHDSMLVGAGSGSAHVGISVSDGVLDDFAKNTLVVPYNNSQDVADLLEKDKEIAGVIIEPVLANMGLVLPQKNFLTDVRKITKENDVPLIFDEIVTGFRVSSGGAQEHFAVKPDITTLGKALGNGFAIAAVGGRKDIMEILAPQGKVYEASTFAGNPVSVSAAIGAVTTINKIKNKLYKKLANHCKKITEAIHNTASDLKISHQINSIGSMFQIFFTEKPVIDYQTAKSSDTKKFHKLFTNLLENGVFIPPSQYETAFLSDAHSDSDISKTISAYSKSLRAIKNEI